MTDAVDAVVVASVGGAVAATVGPGAGCGVGFDGADFVAEIGFTVG